MTIIYLINHSASKLFNEVSNCLKLRMSIILWAGAAQLPGAVSSHRLAPSAPDTRHLKPLAQT